MTGCLYWLYLRLKDEPFVLCDTIREEAKAQGYTKKQLKEARKILGVTTFNDWAANEGDPLNWFWELP